MIKYYSTNGQEAGVTLAQALLTGQASDRGLYMPDRYPTLDRAVLTTMKDKSYATIAYKVLKPFAAGTFDDDTLRAACESAYDFEVPLEQVGDGRQYLMRLDRGPTASFKDFAARMMSRWMSLLMRQQGGRLVILTATSGDTGSAVAHAYHGIDRVDVVVLFPVDEVSDRQRRQMTTLGGNVTTIAVNGKFDDCQALVKQAFADPDLNHIRLTSANSINIGRLLPQSVYYVYAYTRLADTAAGEPMVFLYPIGELRRHDGWRDSEADGAAGFEVHHCDKRERRGAALPGDRAVSADCPVASLRIERDERRASVQSGPAR